MENVRYDWQNVMNENIAHVYGSDDLFSSKIAYPLLLADGTTLSIQASSTHYCSPRKTLNDYNEFEEFEIGFPIVEIEEIKEYAEDPSDYTGTVYGWVPKDVIDQVVKYRGGVTCSISFEDFNKTS